MFRALHLPRVFIHRHPLYYELPVYLFPHSPFPLTTLDFDTFPLARTRLQMYKRTCISVQWDCRISPAPLPSVHPA
jgi:hypothetical protein